MASLLREDLKKDNLIVFLKGALPNETYGCQYVISIKKKKFDRKIVGNEREYIIFRKYSDFVDLHRSIVDSVGIDARRRLPILGPNPFCRRTFPAMEMDEIRKELAMKRLSDMIHIIMEHRPFRLRHQFCEFLKPEVSTSRRKI